MFLIVILSNLSHFVLYLARYRRCHCHTKSNINDKHLCVEVVREKGGKIKLYAIYVKHFYGLFSVFTCDKEVFLLFDEGMMGGGAYETSFLM